LEIILECIEVFKRHGVAAGNEIASMHIGDVGKVDPHHGEHLLGMATRSKHNQKIGSLQQAEPRRVFGRCIG
ncbi:hypothetical protein CH063_07415, partial [Colletotrichum higginsianum]